MGRWPSPVTRGIMVSNPGDVQDSEEVSEYMARTKAKEDRLKGMILAVIVVVASLLVMIGGIKLIGQAQDYRIAVDGPIYYWDTVDLEYGIFGALIGTLALALSIMHLTSVRRKWSRDGP